MQQEENCCLCDEAKSKLVCAQCATYTIQQKRTTLLALKADVSVLRKKSEKVLQRKQKMFDTSEKLGKSMQAVEELKGKVIQARERLCQDRINLARKQLELEEKEADLKAARTDLSSLKKNADDTYSPVIMGLLRHTSWKEEVVFKIRQQKLKQLGEIFQLIKKNSSKSFVSCISGIPLPVSGDFSQVPVEVVASALGRIVHLLTMLTKYIRVTYPHPMIFNSSFSTIGNTGEGAGCHTVFPDGSLGFDRGFLMLLQNVKYVCISQGLKESELHPTDIIGNLIALFNCPTLGFYDDNSEMDSDESNDEDDQYQISLAEKAPEILPEYTNFSSETNLKKGESHDTEWDVVNRR